MYDTRGPHCAAHLFAADSHDVQGWGGRLARPRWERGVGRAINDIPHVFLSQADQVVCRQNSALENVATSPSEDAIHRCLGRTKGRATHIVEVIRGERHCFQWLGVGWGSRAANLKAEMAADGSLATYHLQTS